ncbi:hypothetical protein PG991_006228 [Apiospora marii]|uniref:Uncharacterized protein n=1 Tax=Apiospora marii TaxID=335849 RepID=A0ABR1SDS0_9PEZI
MDTIPPPGAYAGTSNLAPRMVFNARLPSKPATTPHPTTKTASPPTPSPQPAATSLANPDNDKILNSRSNNTPNNSYFASLVRYWGPQWRSPKPAKSQELLAVAVFVFTSLYFLYYLTQHFLRAESCTSCALPAFILLKLVSVGYQIYLGNEHAVLRRKAYDKPFRGHEPVIFGFIAVCSVLVVRTVGFGYVPDADLLLYWIEIWFWAAYWVEWWTGVYSQYMLGELGVI